MLQVFCDDSGTDRVSTPFCALAGYVSSVDGWNRFSDQWQAELLNEPVIKYLKATEAEGRKGQFLGWDSTARDHKLLKLVAVIKANVIGGIGSFVSNKAYNAVVSGFVPGTLDHPYYLCFQRVVLETVQVYKQHADGGKINLVFDKQGKHFERRADLIHNAWADVLASPYADLIGGISFESDSDMLPLQAADMLAWHMRRHADSMVTGSREHRAVAELLWSIPTPTRAWEPQEMNDFVVTYQALHPDSPFNRPDLHSRGSNIIKQ